MPPLPWPPRPRGARRPAASTLLLLLAAESHWACAAAAEEDGVDLKVKLCAEVVDEFNFGLVEVDHFDEQTGQKTGTYLTKRDPDKDPTVNVQWAQYQDCVRYLTKDPWTRAEYLGYATQAGHEQEPGAAPRRLPRSLLLGTQHSVVLTPGKPIFSRFFLIPAYDFVVGSFVKHGGTYDPAEEQFLRALLSEGDCAIEVGSNIGAYTVVLADQVGKSGLVYALEPFRKIFQIMNANLALQGYGNVITKQLGVSNKRQVVRVQAPNLNDFTNLGAARVFYQQKEEVSRVPFDGWEEIEVETLDGLRIQCGQSGADGEEKKVDFIKIDAEGMELEVVEGGLTLINAHQPLIYVESQPYFQAGDDSFLRKMREYGYWCSPVPDLQMHELLICIPLSRRDELAKRFPVLRR